MSNLGLICPENAKTALALLQFQDWIDAGVAIVPEAPRGWPQQRFPTSKPPLGSQYPAFTERQAWLSLERARRQFAKGNIDGAEFAEIVRRCKLVMPVLDDGDE